jgi:hypothetical protein
MTKRAKPAKHVGRTYTGPVYKVQGKPLDADIKRSIKKRERQKAKKELIDDDR